MALLDKCPPKMLEELLDSIMNRAILMAAVLEPGRRCGDPVRQFYAGPPLEVYTDSGHDYIVPDESIIHQVVTVNICSQTVEGSPEAIASMARQECMQKHIAREIRDRADDLARAMFMGACPPIPCSLGTDKD